MIVDCHVHIVGPHRENYVSPGLARTLAFRMLARRFRDISGGTSRDPILNSAVQSRMEEWLTQSIVDRAVALALDAPYRSDGSRDNPKKCLIISNDSIADLVSKSDKLLFGASIHPYRPDALQELERVVANGACLIKWLPAAQNIEPDHPRCVPFYEAMAHFKIPLLCHTGSEHLLRVYPNSFNDPRRLQLALARGVTVIAAHCGTRMFLYEKCYFGEWMRMAREYENFYGDLAAFILWTRLGPLRKIVREPLLTSKLIFGSDFPTLHFPMSYLTQLVVRDALYLRRVPNPFTQAVLTFKAAGVPEAVFSRAYDVLQLGRLDLRLRDDQKAVVVG